MVRIILLLLLAISVPASADENSRWKVTELTGPGSVKNSAELRPAVSCSKNTCIRGNTRPFKSEGKPAPNGLPDGKIAASKHFSDIVETWYILPTRRYDHGILGDKLEAGGFAVKTSTGRVVNFKLPDDQVYEDRTPRLVDLDGDGKAEIVTILTSISLGGAIAIYGLKDGKIEKRTQTPFIGLTNRWLNIAGFADFNGDGRMDIVGVWTPHIGGTLKFWTLNGGNLELIASEEGFSNHFIGSPEQRLSAISDVDGNGTPDLIVPSSDRGTLRMMGFVNGRLEQIASLPLPDSVDKAIAVIGKGQKTEITLGLSDNSTIVVHK